MFDFVALYHHSGSLNIEHERGAYLCGFDMLARRRLPLRLRTSRTCSHPATPSHRRLLSVRPQLSRSSDLDRDGTKPLPSAFSAHPPLSSSLSRSESLPPRRSSTFDKEYGTVNSKRVPRRLKKSLDQFGVVDPEDDLASNKGRHFQDEVRSERNRHIKESRMVKLGMVC